MLVSYANEDYANAIIHIGNLLIDEVLVVEEIMGKLEWAGKCVYWSWLARVMIEKRYCDARMINMCCKMIKLAKEK